MGGGGEELREAGQHALLVLVLTSVARLALRANGLAVQNALRSPTS